MPGCLEDARAVVNGEFEKLPDCEHVSHTEGNDDCSRDVYRVGDLVYKVDGCRKDNQVEFRILSDLSYYEWAPPVSLFDVDEKPVLCMPYYANEESEEYPAHVVYSELAAIEHIIETYMRKAFGKRCATADMHNGNYRVSNGKITVIDAAGNINL